MSEDQFPVDKDGVNDRWAAGGQRDRSNLLVPPRLAIALESERLLRADRFVVLDPRLPANRAVFECVLLDRRLVLGRASASIAAAG